MYVKSFCINPRLQKHVLYKFWKILINKIVAVCDFNETYTLNYLLSSFRNSGLNFESLLSNFLFFAKSR